MAFAESKHRGTFAIVESIEQRLLMSAYAVADLGQGSAGEALGTPVADVSGNLYGVESDGGSSSDGAVYEIATGTQTVTTLASFNSTNGQYPLASLAVDASGNLWGATSAGGSNSDGTLFEIPAGTSTITTIVNFTVTNGEYPQAGLLLGSDGNLYGSTTYGGANSSGELFKLNPQTHAFSILYSMPSGGSNQIGMLARDAGGNIYGTLTENGTSNDGDVFEYSSSNVFSTLVNFNGSNGQNPTGLIINSAGDLFGTTFLGGSLNEGTVFEIPAGTSTLNTLFSFTGDNGEDPQGNLAIDSHGNIFGTTSNGGSGGSGLLYEIPAGTTSQVVLDSFAQAGGLDIPSFSPWVDSQGDLYATALATGQSGQAEVVKFYPATATQIVATAQPENYIAGTSTSVSVEVEDSLGDPIVNDTAPLSLSIAAGPAGAIIDTQPVAPQSGFAELNIDPTVAGAYMLEVSNNELAPLITGSFTVSAASQTALKFSQVPSSAIIDAALSPLSVEAVDQFGNLVNTDDNSLIVLSMASNPGYAVLGGTLTASTDGGIATFANVSIDSVGSYQLAAVAGAGLQPAVSAAFSVNPLPVTQFVVATAPSSANPGQTLSPIVVDLENADSSIVASDTRAVTLSVLDSTGAVTSTTTVDAIAGVATFSNLSLPAAGNYMLSATDSTGTPAASVAVQVVAPATPVVLPTPTVVAGDRLAAIETAIAPDTADPKARQVATISIGTGPTGARLFGTTSVRVSNATAVFKNLILTRTGSYTLKITDSSGVVTTVNRIVTPAATARLIFVAQPPASTAVGIAFSTSIEALDRFGNVNTTDSASLTVELMATKNSAILSGAATESLDNGIAIFSNLAINLPGDYRLVVKKNGLKETVSKVFKIV